MTSLLSSIKDAVEADSDRRRRVLEALISAQSAKDRAKAEKARKEAADRLAHPIWKREEDRLRQREERRRSEQAHGGKKELEGCTFAPSLNQKSLEMAGSRPRNHLMSPTLSRSMKLRESSTEKGEAYHLIQPEDAAWLRSPSESKKHGGSRSISPRSTPVSSATKRVDGPQEYDPAARAVHFAADAGSQAGVAMAVLTPEVVQAQRANFAGYTPKPLAQDGKTAADGSNNTASHASNGTSHAYNGTGAAAAQKGEERRLPTSTHIIQPPPPPGAPDAKPTAPPRQHTQSLHAIQAAFAAEQDARDIVAHAVASGFDEAVMSRHTSPSRPVPSDEMEADFMAATAPLVGRAVAKAMAALGMSGDGNQGNDNGLATRPAPPTRRRSLAAQSEAPPGPPPGMPAHTAHAAAHRSVSPEMSMPDKLRSLVEEEGYLRAKDEFMKQMETLRDTDRAAFLEQIDAMKRSQADMIEDIHAHYERVLASLSAKPSETHLAEYAELSHKYLTLEHQHQQVLSREKALQSELATLQQSRETFHASIQSTDNELRAMVETLQSEKKILMDKVAVLESDLGTFRSMHDVRMNQLTKDHEVALQILRTENEATMDALIAQHAKLVRSLQDSRSRELAALQNAMEEKVAVIIREKEQAVSALQATRDVEIEAALAAADLKAASTVLAVAASIGIPELSSPRRTGVKFPTSPAPANKSQGMTTPDSKRSPLDVGEITAPPGTSYVELLEALALEFSNVRHGADGQRISREAFASKVKQLEQLLAEKDRAAEDARSKAKSLEIRALDLQARMEETTAERDMLKAERESWMAQLESDNNKLRLLFQDARDAKEQMLEEMARLEEDRTALETERAAFLSREQQLVQCLTSRGLSVPPVYQLAPAHAAAISKHGILARAPEGEPSTPQAQAAINGRASAPTRVAPTAPGPQSPEVKVHHVKAEALALRERLLSTQ